MDKYKVSPKFNDKSYLISHELPIHLLIGINCTIFYSLLQQSLSSSAFLSLYICLILQTTQSTKKNHWKLFQNYVCFDKCWRFWLLFLLKRLELDADLEDGYDKNKSRWIHLTYTMKKMDAVNGKSLTYSLGRMGFHLLHLIVENHW